MSEITLKIDKGNSSSFSEIMELLQGFPGLKECRKHYSVKLKEDDIFRVSINRSTYLKGYSCAVILPL